MSFPILVVEDDEVVIQFVDLVLSNAGYTVSSARTGALALEVLERSRPALVLLDINLPDGSGVKVLDQIRRVRRSTVPVMMMTSKGDAETVRAALAAGASGYLVKPFKPAQLIARVRALLAPPPPAEPQRSDAAPTLELD